MNKTINYTYNYNNDYLFDANIEVCYNATPIEGGTHEDGSCEQLIDIEITEIFIDSGFAVEKLIREQIGNIQNLQNLL